MAGIENLLPQYVDSTMISCARQCLEKFRLEFCWGLRPPGISIDLHAGACYATAIEATLRGIHEKNLSLDDALERAHFAFLVAWGDVQMPENSRNAKTLDRVWQAVSNPEGDTENRGYFDIYSPHTDPLQPYFDASGLPTLEYTFSVPLEPCSRINDGTSFPLHPDGSPFLYSGRFDMLGRLGGRAKPVVKDDKTTGYAMGADWAARWNLRSQFLGYVWACQQCGIDLDTVLVRGVGILKTKIHHAEAEKTYSSFLIDRWHEQLRRDLWRIRQAWDSGYFDFNLGESCTAYGNCMFMDVCQSRSAENWYNSYEVRRWNPLQKNPIAAAKVAA